jgi:LPXTG-motif cell wall-anchored protein
MVNNLSIRKLAGIFLFLLGLVSTVSVIVADLDGTIHLDRPKFWFSYPILVILTAGLLALGLWLYFKKRKEIS